MKLKIDEGILIDFRNRVTKIDVQKLRRTGKDYDFEEIYLIMNEFIEVERRILVDMNFLIFMSQAKIQEFANKTKVLLSDLENIANFNPLSDNPNNLQTNLSNAFINHYDTFKRDFVIPFKVHELEKDTKRIGIKEKEEELKELIEQVKNLKTELTVKAVEASVSNYAEVFQTEANRHSRASWLWLGGALVMAVITLSVIVAYFDYHPMYSNQLSYIVTKITVLLLLFFLVTFLFKQFSVNRHLYTLNKHRENTLNSYKLFIEGLGESEMDVRNAIMMQVAKAIYEQGKSGYINEKGGDMETPSVIELIRTIPSKDK